MRTASWKNRTVLPNVRGGGNLSVAEVLLDSLGHHVCVRFLATGVFRRHPHCRGWRLFNIRLVEAWLGSLERAELMKPGPSVRLGSIGKAARINRRDLLIAAGSLIGSLANRSAVAEPIKELRIGYQKVGYLLIVKSQKLLEQRFESQGVSVKWVEFAFGPPLLEALGVGAIDYGYAGDAPPIFAQAAHANLLYAAVMPSRGYGQRIVVAGSSPIKALADLKGRKIAVAKGSSAHNLLIAALESAKIAWSAIVPVYLAPADAAAAFAGGAVDAWSIWDPFFAIAELKDGARALPVDPDVSAQNGFFLVNGDFAAKHPDVVATINAAVAAAVKWAAANREEVATAFAEASGVSLAAEKRSVDRAEFVFGGLNDQVLSQQQAVADRFLRLGLIPAPIRIRDIVWPWKSNS